MLKKLRKKLANKKGYISLEYLIVAGLVLALGAFVIHQYFFAADDVLNVALDNIRSVTDVTIE